MITNCVRKIILSLSIFALFSIIAKEQFQEDILVRCMSLTGNWDQARSELQEKFDTVGSQPTPVILYGLQKDLEAYEKIRSLMVSKPIIFVMNIPGNEEYARVSFIITRDASDEIHINALLAIGADIEKQDSHDDGLLEKEKRTQFADKWTNCHSTLKSNKIGNRSVESEVWQCTTKMPMPLLLQKMQEHKNKN